MLVLSRKAGEKIQIGRDITVTVTRISETAVRIGIEAPHNVRIDRTEIVERAVDTRVPPEVTP